MFLRREGSARAEGERRPAVNLLAAPTVALTVAVQRPTCCWQMEPPRGPGVPPSSSPPPTNKESRVAADASYGVSASAIKPLAASVRASMRRSANAWISPGS